MAFIYITGAPGVGKTTITDELSKQGFEIHDLDQPSLGGAHNKLSGERVKIPRAENRSPEWFDNHEWRLNKTAFEDLKAKSLDQNIIICGVAEADSEILDLFDKILYLSIADEDLKTRIKNRLDNDFGKNKFELETILNRKAKLDLKYDSKDIIKIDASGELPETINRIKRYVEK